MRLGDGAPCRQPRWGWRRSSRLDSRCRAGLVRHRAGPGRAAAARRLDRPGGPVVARVDADLVERDRAGSRACRAGESSARRKSAGGWPANRGSTSIRLSSNLTQRQGLRLRPAPLAAPADVAGHDVALGGQRLVFEDVQQLGILDRPRRLLVVQVDQLLGRERRRRPWPSRGPRASMLNARPQLRNRLLVIRLSRPPPIRMAVATS